MSFRGNYLDVTPDDVLRLSPEDADVLAGKVAQMILAEFRALDCTVCEKHFAYQHRADHRILLCSSECLALAQKKLKLMTTSAGSNLRLSTSLLASPGLWDGSHTGAAQRTINYVTKLQDSKALLGAETQKNSKSGATEVPQKDGQEQQLIDEPDGVVQNVAKRQPFANLDSALNVKNSQVRVPKVSPNSSPFHPKASATKTFQEPKLSPTKTSPFSAQPEKAGPASPSSAQPKQSTYARSNESRETYGNNARQVFKPAENKESNMPKMTEVKRPTVTPPALKTSDIKESPPSRAVVAPQIQQRVAPRSPTAPKPEANEGKPEQRADKLQTEEQPKLSVVKNIVRRPQSKKVWTTADIKRSSNIKAGVKCYVNFAWSPARLTIIAVPDWDNLESMRNEVKKYCESAEPLSRPPAKNDIVFASYNDGFYRAVVLDVRKEKGELDILFPDDGDKICVQITDCRPPSDEIMIKHPIYGGIFECVTSVPVPDDLPVSQPELLEGEVFFENETETPNGWRGKLFASMKDSGKKICWNDILEQGLKKVVVAAPQKVVESQGEATLKDPAIIKAGKVTPPLSASNHTLLTIPISPKFKNGSAVTVAFCWNPREIVVSAVDDATSTNDLAVLVKNYISEAKPLTEKPALNDVVLCPYFGEYYRGVVEELLADGTIRCRFIDYGDEATVKLDELREINDAVAAHPIYGLMLTMAEIPEEKLDSIPPTVEALQPAIVDQVECKLEMKEEINHGIWKGDLRVPSGQMWTAAILDALKGGANRK